MKARDESNSGKKSGIIDLSDICCTSYHIPYVSYVQVIIVKTDALCYILKLLNWCFKCFLRTIHTYI